MFNHQIEERKHLTRIPMSFNAKDEARFNQLMAIAGKEIGGHPENAKTKVFFVPEEGEIELYLTIRCFGAKYDLHQVFPSEFFFKLFLYGERYFEFWLQMTKARAEKLAAVDRLVDRN